MITVVGIYGTSSPGHTRAPYSGLPTVPGRQSGTRGRAVQGDGRACYHDAIIAEAEQRDQTDPGKNKSQTGEPINPSGNFRGRTKKGSEDKKMIITASQHDV